MKKALVVILFFAATFSLFAQQYFIHGSVKDSSKNSYLSYANIRVLNSTIGTSANKNGSFELKLPLGNYKLIASFIGYMSDTVSINLRNNIDGINFYLSQTNLNFPEIVVKPGDNPALKIIRNAIAKKKERDRQLQSYEFEAYTKGIIKSQKDIRANGNSVGIGIGSSDTTALKITGILENESKGYFKKPDDYKEIIIARKQSSNFPSTVNVLTGGRIIKNFSADNIDFFGKPIPGPLASNALKYYFYYIKNTLAIDNKPVYEIFMTPDDPDNPGFVGDIYIADSSFDLIKVNLRLNRAANTGGIFDSVNIFQQFTSFNDSIYMPVDYRLFVKANVLGLAKFGFELNIVLYDYKINQPVNNNMFNKAVLTVLPDADEKDSTYWENAVTIPNTIEEQKAYERIDSLSNVPRTFWDDFSPLSSRLRFSENFSTSAPLGMYHFNRVEGNSIDFGLFMNNINKERLNSSARFSYGFADRKLKADFDFSYFFGNYRTYKLSFNAFNKLNILFGNSDNYNELTATVLALVSKDDFRDYYYTNGFDINASGEVFPVLNLNAGIVNHTDKSAAKNTEFSFFAKDKTFPFNPPIYPVKIIALKAGFSFDFRDYIENGLFIRRISQGQSYITFGGEVTYSNNSILKTGLDFTKYEFNSRGVLNTFNSAKLNFRIYGMYTNGQIPYQSLYALPGNIDLTAMSYSFRTINVNQILGDRLFTINLEHDFSDELFRMLKIPYLKNWELQLTGFLNIAYSDVSPGTKSILLLPAQTFRHPFYEAGFEIGQVLFPMQLDFAWRLNYRGVNNFRFGINTFIF